MQSSMVRPFERSRKNILTRRANHRHIFIVARIRPAPENPPRAFESDDALSGHALPSAPNLTNRRFRHCASHPSSTQTLKTNPALSARARSHHGLARRCPQLTVGDLSCLVTLWCRWTISRISMTTHSFPLTPQGPPQQRPATGAGQPDAGAPATGGVLSPLTENGRFDSYVYKNLSTGTPPAGPQVIAAGSNRKITATDNANRTNFGGVYGHTLTLSEPGSNDLGTVTAADPTGLLVATPVEGDPSLLSIREYKGY
jgi:hypothetical protein